MSTGTLYKFNPKIFFFARLSINHKSLNDEGIKYMMEVKEKFFDIPLGQEVGDFFLLQLSRGLAGDITSEKNNVWHRPC